MLQQIQDIDLYHLLATQDDMSMLTALIRVATRAAEIQLEEVAASAALRTATKGKRRATLPDVDQLEGDRWTRSSARSARLHGEDREAQPSPSPDLKDSFRPASVDLRSKAGPSAPSTFDTAVNNRLDTSTSEAAVNATAGVQSDLSVRTDELPLAPGNPSSSFGFSEDGLDTPGAGPSTRPVVTTNPSVTLEHSDGSLDTPSEKSSDHDTIGPLQNATAGISPERTRSLDQGPGRADPLLESEDEEVPVVLRASKVPSSRLGRLLHYGSLAASMSLGAATESFRRTTGGDTSKGSVFMSDANIRRLVASLGRMRGAALKLGQFMSIQDNHLLPPEIEQVLQQVQAHANYMPDWQMEQVMSSELGPNWQSLFSSFDRTPIASASIGQVHRARLASTGQDVAVKIQFPGIALSIHSDLNNLSILLRASSLLPRGMYLQNTIAVMRRELEDECDYVREGAAGKRFSNLLEDDDFFTVPKVIDEATTGNILTTEWAKGRPLSQMKRMSQATRDEIGTNILRLCLQELFQFRFMQTDPNWANFLYDASTNKITLIDFGASREYTKEFMDGWYSLLTAALRDDRVAMKEQSESLGYLTGEENEEMLKAHLDSMALIASPFSTSGPYSFANQTITASVRALIPTMLQHRLTPPPPETYSLNRKLSGAFLMCARLGANVDCATLWEEQVGNYQVG